MLDQNTDRMWFVIGAVIVGAAIIFIANGTLPDIFASITDTFESSSNDALAVVNQIGEENNLLDDTQEGVSEEYRLVSWADWDKRLYELDFEEYGLKPGDSVTFKVYIDNPETSVLALIQARDDTNDFEGFALTTHSMGNTIHAGSSGWSTITWEISPKTVSGNDTTRVFLALRNASRTHHTDQTSTRYRNATFSID